MFNDQHALSLVCAMAIAFFALSPALQANGDDLNALALVSGEPIPAGTEGGLGPLAPVITQNPVGSAFVFGSEEPDLFVIGRGWYRTKRGRFSHLYLFPWVATATSGAPVFGVPIQVKTEFFGPGTVFQTDDNVIHGVWLSGSVLVHTVYDVEKHSFSETERVSLPKLPRSPSEVAVLPNPDGSVEILLGIGDGVVSRPTDFPDRDPRYQPYDGAGIWRGGFPYRSLYAVSLPGLLKGPAESPRQVSQTKKDVRNTYSSLTAVNLGPEHERDIVTGDSAFFNRQPSLERSALGVHRVVVLEDPSIHTFQMNVIACAGYNADFNVGVQQVAALPAEKAPAGVNSVSFSLSRL